MPAEDAFVSSVSTFQMPGHKSSASFCTIPSTAFLRPLFQPLGAQVTLLLFWAIRKTESKPSYKPALSEPSGSYQLLLRKLQKGPVWSTHYFTSRTHFKKLITIPQSISARLPSCPQLKLHPASTSTQMLWETQICASPTWGSLHTVGYCIFASLFAWIFAPLKQLLCELVLVYRGQLHNTDDIPVIGNTA